MPGTSSVVATLLIIPLAILVALYSNKIDNVPFVEFIISRSRLSVTVQTAPKVRDLLLNVTYHGRHHEGVEQFLGVFYAQDTAGENRFAPPKAVAHTPGVILDATSAGAWCPQGTGDPPLPFTSPITNISENCLSLGITRPEGTTETAKLPVIVWMHGGGHALGSYADQLYLPDGLVKQSSSNGKPIIFVGINYRLGIFRFARSDSLSKAGYTNAGLKDQRAAFEWIKQNIAAFGGDPDNVVSIGQSVGASDTALHLISYGGTKGVPFSKAVMMSGAPATIFNIKSDLVERNTAAVAEALNCSKGGDPQSEAAMKCLQGAPLEKLVNISVTASRLARPPFGEGFFYPTYGGEYIPDRPSELLRQGKFVRNIPVMASWVTNDGAWYAPPQTVTDDQVTGSFGLWLTNLSQETLAPLLQLYPESDFEQLSKSASIGGQSPQYYRAAQLNRDLWFTCPVLDFAHHHAFYSPDPQITPTYLYEHNATRFTPIFRDIMHVPFWGVSHLSDIPYMLNNDVAAGGDNSAPAKALSKQMSTALINFAYSGNPSDSWPQAFTPEHINESRKVKEIANDNLPSTFRMMVFQHEEPSQGSGPVIVDSVGTADPSVMEDEATARRTRAVQWENLFERCNFINSAKVREEIGV